MLAVRTAVAGSAGYVAIERVTGTLAGRTGTFALQHWGMMDKGAPDLWGQRHPDPVTGDLAGLAGTMTIDIQPGGKHFYAFNLHAAAGREMIARRFGTGPHCRARDSPDARRRFGSAAAWLNGHGRSPRRGSRRRRRPGRAQRRGRRALGRDCRARVDPHVAKVRVVVLTDIANEPDDQMSLVRLLVYSNHFDIEGLVATTSTWLDRRAARRLHTVVDAYAQVRPKLEAHATGFPEAAASTAGRDGQPAYGMAGVGADKYSPGGAAVGGERPDPRPLWISGWGGTNTLAQALIESAHLTPRALQAVVAKLRVYTISDQDEPGRGCAASSRTCTTSRRRPRRTARSTRRDVDGYLRRSFLRNAPGADFETFTDAWVNANIRAGGRSAGTTLSVLHSRGRHTGVPRAHRQRTRKRGESHYGGWGGRYMWRQPHGESRPFWTQGGDSYPGRDTSRDTVEGADGHATRRIRRQSGAGDAPSSTISRRAWRGRWARARQPQPGRRRERRHRNRSDPVIDRGGQPVELDAAGTRDPDGHQLNIAGGSIRRLAPASPASRGRRPPVGGGGNAATGGSRPRPEAARRSHGSASKGRPRLPRDAATCVPGTAHVILEVTDDGTPSLTSYRRVILRSPARCERLRSRGLPLRNRPTTALRRSRRTTPGPLFQALQRLR